jgi:hypothetical protein
MGRARSADPRQALRIARVEVVRSVRAIIADRRQLTALALVFAMLLPLAGLLLTSTYAAGQRVAAGVDVAIVPLARAQITAWIASLSVLLSLRVIDRSGDADHADLLLTTVSPRAVASGLVLAEFVRICVIFGLPLAAVVSAFALGASAPLLVPLVLLGAVPVFAVGLLGGFALGYTGRLLIRRVGTGDGLPRAVLNGGVVLFVFLGVTYLLPSEPVAALRALVPLGAVPVGPYADLLLVGEPFGATPGLRSAVAALLILGALPPLAGAVWWLAPRVWFGDPRADSGDSAENRRALFGTTTAPGPLARTRTLRLVWWQWLRGLRAPTQFVHLTYFLFMTYPILQIAIASPGGPVTPAFLGVLGALLAGGTFGLNPLGMEGSMLPSILTTPEPGRTLARARILAGTLVWLPLALVGVLAVGFWGVLDASTVALLVVVTVVLTAFSTTVALALGAFSPRFETVRAFGGVEAPTPTTIALLGHSFLTTIVAAFGFLAVLLPLVLDTAVTTGGSELFVQIGGVVAWAALLLAVAFSCYRYAVGRLNTFVYE